SRKVSDVYPDGIHGALAKGIGGEADFSIRTATLDEPEHGLTQEVLDATDVLVWWGHKAHGAVEDAVVDRVVSRVHQGMGLIVLHSGHFSKPFIRLMGTPCSLRWREAGERERLWAINRSHPILAGLGDRIEIPNEEMYGEPFLVPEPMETVLISWFEGGEVFRSGMTWQRGAGKIFYFRPGHETYPTYHDATVRQLLRNAVRWAHNPAPPWTDVGDAPNVPVDRAPEPLTPKGGSLHAEGEEGYR
ncbi:MAG: ThuA domain-containing protein, partial [Rhodobacteraceae bacterium]|nr:ThuA domain-containing protein [Paracoccaceae bacterium]